MSGARVHSTGAGHPAGEIPEQPLARSSEQGSFLERFFNSFFQEKSIKWMLVIGAGIVFGSSLKLVTQQWDELELEFQFLTILGYTAAIFAAAEVSRKRFGLVSTYKVLHSLTLLLLPVCFLALHWLSAGSAAQGSNLIVFCGLLLPAGGFLWFASSRILDHLLRGRQTTFLISYCLLCVAGALPAFALPQNIDLEFANQAATRLAFAAFAFLSVCWAIFTAGVVKVNRHTFWLAEEHQLPRIFGFMPIAMLGLQFIVLVGTKTISTGAIPLEWIGFGCVMVSATVLLTTRTIADVFRQRTGDLIRPLPWTIVIPLFSGLVLTLLGLMLSFHGFSYVNNQSFAVIPTAVVAALLMGMAARDTRHAGFVWASMICTAIAYQCCPTLFADIIQSLRDSTAAAMNEERVPISMYGVTYLPLLGTFAAASRWFANRGKANLSRPFKHFVTAVGLMLFSIAVTNTTSLLFVSLANMVAFTGFAIAFRDRRYVIPALTGLVLAAAATIPAYCNVQGLSEVEAAPYLDWVPTVLAGLATLLTATQLPDRILNTIPICGSVVRHRNVASGRLTKHSLLLQNTDGSDRGLTQISGYTLACVTAAHWIGQAIFDQFALTEASFLQYVFLMSAFVLYTLRNPRYISGLCFWSMAGFAALRWAATQDFSQVDVLKTASFVTAASSLLGYLLLKMTGRISPSSTLRDLRHQLGFSSQELTATKTNQSAADGWMRRWQAFVVPLCDLSLVTLSCLAVGFHLPVLLMAHLPIVTYSTTIPAAFGLSTAVTVGWLVVATVVFRSRTAGIAAAIAVPLWATATMISLSVPLSMTWCPVIWTLIEAVILVICTRWKSVSAAPKLPLAITRVSEVWLQTLLIFSCLSFDWPLRVAALICIGSFAIVDGKRLNGSRASYLAIMANIHVLLLAAAIGGCRGIIVRVFMDSSNLAIPYVFLTTALSVAAFDIGHRRLDAVLTQSWSAILRACMIFLALISLTGPVLTGEVATVVMMMCGFAIAGGAEAIRAVREQKEWRVWTACGIGSMSALFLFAHNIVSFGAGKSQFVLLGISACSLCLAHFATTRKDMAILRRPMLLIGQTLPALVAIMAIFRQVSGLLESNIAWNALALMLSAGIYFQQAMVTRKRGYALLACTIMNAGLMLLWRSMKLDAPEFYLVPVGLSILAFVELLKKELPRISHDPLRYMGALTILVSPLFEVIDGNWAHILTLMVLSVVGILAAIGLRIRVLVYAGSAFLLADLVAMVVHGAIANPALLWVGGVALGIGVIALAAFCENHREKLLTRIRFVSAELAAWS